MHHTTTLLFGRFASFSEAIAFGAFAVQYRELRELHPEARALTIGRYIRDNRGLMFEQFACETHGCIAA